MRLIDADALDFGFAMTDDMNGMLKQIGIEMAKARVDKAPTIEAEPVRHGRWVDNHCSECGEMPMGTEAWERLGIEPPRFEWFMDFRPCCGAKMRGDTDGQA